MREELGAIRRAKAEVQVAHGRYASAQDNPDVLGFYESRRPGFSFVQIVLEQ